MQFVFEDISFLVRGASAAPVQHIKAVAPDTYVLAEEDGYWEDAKRRIDLLCIDKNAGTVQR